MSKNNSSSFKNEPGYGRPSDGKIYIGIVKNVIDAQRMGRLEVYIPEFGGDPNDRNRWHLASYGSPFAGSSNIDTNVAESQSESGSQTSYGWWAIPPDINNEVLVVFAGGEQTKAFWIACLYQQNMNHTVPGFASNRSFEPGDQGIMPPVTEYNKRDSGVTPNNPQRPRYEPLHNALMRQGLYSDFQRGPTSSSARRESPSRVSGFSTPRGHHWYFDDDVNNGHFRLRMRNGAQMVMNDNTGFIYFITSMGNSWLEISDAGIDMFTKGSISARAQQDFNIRADRNINLDAGGVINMIAGGNIGMMSETSIGLQAPKISDSSELKSTTSGTIYRNGFIYDNSGGGEEPIPIQLFSRSTEGGEIESPTSRMPTHEPWDGHPRSETISPPTGDVSMGNVGVVGNGDQRTDVPFNEPREPAQQTVDQTTGEGDYVEVDYDAEADAKKVNVGSYNISERVLSAIRRASEVSGVEFGFMMAMAAKESSFDPRAIPMNKSTGKPYSSAKGLYQILDRTWKNLYNSYGKKFGIPDDRFDPYANALMAAMLTKENDNALRRYGLANRGPTEWYMAHFLGPFSAYKILTAPASATSISIVGQDAATANPWVFYNKNRTRPKQAGEIVQSFRSFIEPRTIAFRSV